MRLPPLPPPPRPYPPSVERSVSSRGLVLVFWIYALVVCGISFLVAGVYGGNRTTIFSGAALSLVGLLVLLLRFTVTRWVSRLLRCGQWTVGRIVRIESGEKKRSLHYVYAVDGREYSGLLVEERPWAEDFVADASAGVLYDPEGPERSLLLSQAGVDAMCDCWRLSRSAPSSGETPR